MPDKSALGLSERPTAEALPQVLDGAVEARHSQPVLVVDDDTGIRESVRELLEFEGYAVVTAANGAQALDAIERVRPALVLLDMRMPILDGWGVARALRARNIRVPILVMTAAQDARRWADEIGADGFVAKPFDLSDLLDAIEEVRGSA